MSSNHEVRAAGGVVHRSDGDHGLQVLLVHRPKYDDWSFPKGKADSDESDEQCALREVEEETGLRCELGRELSESRYADARGRAKVVRHWAMRPLAGEFAPHDEVDQVRWCTTDAAGELLSYERDRELLEDFLASS